VEQIRKLKFLIADQSDFFNIMMLMMIQLTQYLLIKLVHISFLLQVITL